MPTTPELAEALRDRQHEVGRRRPFGQTVGQAEADDLGNQHRDRLAEHRGLRFDPADAPADDAEPVDHRRVGVGADERVGIGQRLAAGLLAEDHAREVLEVDLVDDAGVGRHDLEVVERRLAPAQERVALLVARELELGVQLGGVQLAVVIDLDRVVDDQLDRLQRVDLPRIAAQPEDAVAHRGEVDDGRHAGEVLEEDAGGHERDLLRRLARDVPPGERPDVVGVDEPAVLAPEQVLQQDLQGVGQPRQPGKPGLFERGEAEILDAPAGGGQRRPGIEGILRGHPLIIPYSDGSRSSRARKSRATADGSACSASTA